MNTTITKHKKKLAGFLFLSLAATQINAQEITLDAEYRPRAELRSGYSKPLLKDEAPDLLMMQRVRLNADYRSKLINATLSIQDARVFGEANAKGEAINNKIDAPKLGIFEAWAELVLPKGIAFRIGRQALSYDDQRLFSKCNWSNTGSAHDLALLTYRFRDFKADLGYAYNNSNSNPTTADYDYGTNSFYRTMAYLWLSNGFGKSGWKISLIGVSEGFQQKDVKTIGSGEEAVEEVSYFNTYKYTYGGNVEFKRKGFPLSGVATAYFQSGKTNTNLELSAYLLAFKLNYQIAKPFTLTAGTDFYSGTEQDVNAKVETNTFSALYGSNHSFNGAMDYWSPAALPTGGLIDLYLSAQYVVCPKVTLLGTFHCFRLAKEMYHSDEKGLGSEIDLDVSYQFCKIANVKAGWSTYFDKDLTKMVKKVKGDTRFNQWAYLSLTVTPQLFSYKK